MSFFPCDWNGHRYRGPANHAYPAIVNGSSHALRHWRLCAEHMKLVYDALQAYIIQEADEFNPPSFASSFCLNCHREVVDGGKAFYATLYGRGEERVDVWAQLHQNCELMGDLGRVWGRTRDPGPRRDADVRQDAPSAS